MANKKPSKEFIENTKKKNNKQTTNHWHCPFDGPMLTTTTKAPPTTSVLWQV